MKRYHVGFIPQSRLFNSSPRNMKYLAMLLLAASPGPSGPNQVQVTRNIGAIYSQLPNCPGDGGTALTFSDGGFSCAHIAGDGASGGGNFGTFTVDFGSGALSVYDSAETTVDATWVTSGSAIALTPKCSSTTGNNTTDNCLILNLKCVVTTITGSASFGAKCYAPSTASGIYTISYVGG